MGPISTAIAAGPLVMHISACLLSVFGAELEVLACTYASMFLYLWAALKAFVILGEVVIGSVFTFVFLVFCSLFIPISQESETSIFRLAGKRMVKNWHSLMGANTDSFA